MVSIKGVKYRVFDGDIEQNKYGQWTVHTACHNERLAQVTLDKMVLADKLDKKLQSMGIDTQSDFGKSHFEIVV